MRAPSPIFVAGLDRAGKTQLRIALARHPSLEMVRRVNLWTEIFGRYGELRSVEQRRAAARAVNRSGELDEARLVGAMDGSPTPYVALFAEFGAQLCARSGRRRWGTQEAHLEWRADAVLRLFPQARIIHLVRDPRDRAAVVIGSSSRRRGGLGAETAAWVASADLARRQAAAHPRSYTTLRYESLVDDPEGTLREVCDFIGESFEPAMLADGPLSQSGRTALVEEIGSFRERLAPWEIAFIQSRAQGLMDAMGYPAEPATPAGDSLPRRALRELGARAGMLAWRYRTRRLRAAAGPAVDRPRETSFSDA